MSENKIDQKGTGNIGIQDVHNSEININLGKSYQYNDLIKQLKTQEKLLSLTPESEAKERLEISAEIDKLKGEVEAFEQDILQLAQKISKSEPSTGTLKNAKEFFEKGEIDEALTIYKATMSFDFQIITPDHLRKFNIELLKGVKKDGRDKWAVNFVLSRKRRRDESEFEQIVNLLVEVKDSNFVKAEKTARHGLDERQVAQAMVAGDIAEHTREDESEKSRKRALEQIEKIIAVRGIH